MENLQLKLHFKGTPFTLENSENQYPMNTIPRPAQELNIIHSEEKERSSRIYDTCGAKRG